MNKIYLYRNYSTTILLSPAYSIGFCASLFIIIQIISGYILASNYYPDTNESFNIIHNIIMRELDTGWLIRFNHINGCALLFVMIYLHIYRSLYHNSINKTSVWIIGIIMYILLCGISFTGYSLVYGQMSLWAIVVICSLVTAIPFIGNKLLILIWGGNIVSSVTLQRIFCVHYLLPLLLILLICIHLYNLHNVNSTGDIYTINNRYDRINFYPLLLIRDLFIGSNILIIFNIFVYYYSDMFGHSDNYIPANPLVTPSEIMPEFYLLPFYALIRAIPHKVLGIILMFLLLLSITNIYPIYLIRFYNRINILNRALLLILIMDVVIASKLCLYINHYESFYLLLILTIIGILNYNIYKYNIINILFLIDVMNNLILMNWSYLLVVNFLLILDISLSISLLIGILKIIDIYRIVIILFKNFIGPILARSYLYILVISLFILINIINISIKNGSLSIVFILINYIIYINNSTLICILFIFILIILIISNISGSKSIANLLIYLNDFINIIIIKINIYKLISLFCSIICNLFLMLMNGTFWCNNSLSFSLYFVVNLIFGCNFIIIISLIYWFKNNKIYSNKVCLY